jgi:hypothetical protein
MATCVDCTKSTAVAIRCNSPQDQPGFEEYRTLDLAGLSERQLNLEPEPPAGSREPFGGESPQ